MKPKLSIWLFLVLPLVGCGGSDGSATASPSFVLTVDHPYLPLEPGTLRTYKGEDEGRLWQEVVSTMDETRVIRGVRCTGVVEEVFIEGELLEVTTEWYAQDVEGSVWKFGEESLELEDGHLVRSEDSWIAGVGGGVQWKAFPADANVGDRFVGYTPDGEDTFEVVSLTATAAVPAGLFQNCLQIIENPEDAEDTDIILYARGVGRVSEQSSDGKIVLVTVQKRK